MFTLVSVGGSANANPLENSLSIEHLLKQPEVIIEEKQKQSVKKYTIKQNDNLVKIASHFHVKWERIYDKNLHIDNPHEIQPDIEILIPTIDEELKVRELPVLTRTTLRQAPVRPQTGSTNPASTNGFEWGWCTYYAQSQRMDKKFRGNAGEWMAFVNGYKPKIGSVAVNTSAAGGLGHVAIVVVIKGDRVLVRHMNWAGFGVISTDWTNKSYWSGYIH